MDWDGVIDAATNTPRARLAELLSRIEDVDFVAFTYRTKDGVDFAGFANADGGYKHNALIAQGMFFNAATFVDGALGEA